MELYGRPSAHPPLLKPFYCALWQYEFRFWPVIKRACNFFTFMQEKKS